MAPAKSVYKSLISGQGWTAYPQGLLVALLYNYSGTDYGSIIIIGVYYTVQYRHNTVEYKSGISAIDFKDSDAPPMDSWFLGFLNSKMLSHARCRKLLSHPSLLLPCQNLRSHPF